MAKKTKALYTVGRMVKPVRLIPSYPVGVPTGAHCDVEAAQFVKGAGWRYQINYRGGRYWVNEDAIEYLA